MYSRIAHEFDVSRFSVWPCVAEFLEARPRGSLLEAGVGNGKNIAAAAAAGYSPTIGFDICEELVSIAQARSPTSEIFLGDLCAPLPLRIRPDTILCIAVLHHIQCEKVRRAALKQLYNALAPSGQLLLTTWSFETGTDPKPRKFSLGDNSVPFKTNDGKIADRFYHIYDHHGFEDLVRSTGCSNYTIDWKRQNWIAIMRN